MIALKKVCPRCKIKFLLNSDNFYHCKDKTSGFRPHCIECCKAMAKTSWGKTSKEAKDRKNYVRKFDIHQRANALFNSYKRTDLKKGIEFDLEKVDMINHLRHACVYCGDDYMPNLGLDRIDNSKGHLKDNVVTCCYECNTARSDLFTFEEMKIIGATIREIKSRRNFPVHGIVAPIRAIS